MDTFVLAAAAAAVTLGVILVVVLRQRRDLILVLLGLSSGIELQIGRFHVATLLSLVLLVTGRLRSPRNLGTAVVTVLCAVPLALTVFVGDSVVNPLLAGQLLLLAGTAAVVLVTSDADDVRMVLRGLLTGTTIGSAVAVLQNFGVVPATQFLDSSGIPRVQSLYREPDFLGAFAAVGVLLAFRIVSRRWLQMVLLSVNAVALTYTFARASWLALAVAALIVVVLSRFDRRGEPAPRSNKALVAGLAMVAVAVLASNAALRDTILARIEGLTTSSSDVSVQARQHQLDTLRRLADDAPWYGYGLSSSGQIAVFGRYPSDASQSVATNWILGWWMDGKLLAVPLIGWFLLTAARTARTVAGQAMILLLINSLFTNLILFPVTWLLLGCALVSRPGGGPDGNRPPQVRREPGRPPRPPAREPVVRGGRHCDRPSRAGTAPDRQQHEPARAPPASRPPAAEAAGRGGAPA